MNTKLSYIIFSIVGIAIFLFIAYRLTSKKAAQTVFPQLKTIISNDHTTWSKNNKILLVEYSDLQCPACKVYHDFLKEIAQDKTITSNITLVYRHFPLDSIHPHARSAAYAAEAAGRQDAFFLMQDILFSKQNEWSQSSDPTAFFKTYAQSLKLDMKKYEAAFAAKETAQKVQNNFLSGAEVDVNATPTFYLDGVKLETPATVAAFKQILSEKITSAKNQ